MGSSIEQLAHAYVSGLRLEARVEFIREDGKEYYGLIPILSSRPILGGQVRGGPFIEDSPEII